MWGGSGSGGSSTGTGGTESGSGTTGGTSTSGSTTDPIPPTPTENHNSDPLYTIAVEVEEADRPDPCTSLKNKYANPDENKQVIKNRTNALKEPLVLNTNHESGFGVTLGPLHTENYVTLVPNGNNAVKIDGLGAYFSVHAHNNDYTNGNGDLKRTVKIPSPTDFEALFNDHAFNAQNLNIPLSEVGVVVVTSQGTYALMLKDFNVDSFVINYGPNANPIKMTEFESQYAKTVKKLEEDGDLTATTLEKMLLNLFPKQKISGRIGLYKATNADCSSWAELEYDSSTDQVIKKPCN